MRLALCCFISLNACAKGRSGDSTSDERERSPRTRAEAVEQADRMAIAAASANKGSAPVLLQRAAELREGLYRSEHRAVDALEAVENLRSLEKIAEDPCLPALRRALLEAELKRDPAELYRKVYALRAQSRSSACRAKSELALVALSAYRPLPSVLAELEHADAASPRAPRGPSAPSAAPSSDANTPARVTAVERYGADDAARVVVFVTRPTRFQAGQVQADGAHPRLFVDVEGATLGAATSYEVGGLVERVRLGAREHGVRVVLDLKAPAVPRVFYLPEPFRLVIDVTREQLFADAGPRRGVRRVVLDPGHGGYDPGASGPSGLREKDVVLDIAHRAAPLIARELGISTLLTRDGDQFVPLDERTARANAFHADLFISIHCNASEDLAARGVMTFVLDAGHEEFAERIAARENAASSEAAAELANAVSRITDPKSRAASARFAELLQRSAMASLIDSYPEVVNAGVKRAGFYVLAGARMPAVLFETSFISNPMVESRLNTEAYRQRVADSIVNAIRAYREGL